MPVVSPVKQDLSSWHRSSDECVSRVVWEICAPESNSLFWSLMCSYLIASSTSGNLIDNFERITGTTQEMSEVLAKQKITKKPDFHRIANRVKNINPFTNAHTLYFDKDLISLMRVFKLRLNRLADQLSKEKGQTYDENMKIQAASTAFRCQIDLYEEDCGNKHQKTFVPEIFEANPSKRLTLVLFKYKRVQKSVYKMGFEPDHSQNLRIKALKHVLSIVKVPSQQARMIIDSNPPEKFLHHLLVRDFAKEVILMLYESSYVLKKLSDAGYDVDPLSIGPDGFSAFYHCIRLNDWELLFTLYNHVTKCTTTQEFSDALKKLKNVKRILEKDNIKSLNFSSLSLKQKEAEIMFSQIQRIITFQCEIFEKIKTIANTPSLETTEKQNRIIVFILSKYEEYFYFINRKTDSQYNQFLDYVQYYNYHKYIDDITFLLFFDNFLSLTLPGSESNTILANNSLIYLLEYLISKNIFHKNYNISAINDSNKDEEKLFVPFCYRMKLKNLFLTFRAKLTCTSSNQNISTMNILISCLKKHPMLEEEFQISRFKEYLKIGGNATFEVPNTAAPFVVERTLQVIGETLSTISDDSVVTPLIKYILPPNLADILCDVRNNCLSHLRISYAQGRKKLETSELLKKIQAELKELIQTFEPIFILQTLRVKEYMIEYGMIESQLYPDHIKTNLNIIKKEITMLKRNFYRSHTDMYVTVAYKIIASLTTHLQSNDISKIKELQRDYKSLKFLLTLITEYCSTGTSDMFVNTLERIDLSMDDILHEKLGLLDAFLSLKNNFECSFKNISNSLYEIDLSNLSALFHFIKQNDFFTIEEEKKIKRSLLEIFEKPEKAKQQLINHANGQNILNNDQVEGLLKEIIANDKIKKSIKANPGEILPLQNKINLSTLFEKDEQFFIDFVRLLGDDKFSDIVPNLCLPKNLHSKILYLSNQRLEFLKDRMSLLEQILIEEKSHLSKWKRYGTSPDGRDHVKRLIRLRYLEEKDTRAALETLLLDCLEILNKRRGFQDLFTKTSNFFCGINLRNFLSHGCPILETANNYLHPNNLSQEMIETILKLIEDQEVIEALIKLWEETKNPKISKLKSIIQNESQDKHSSLRDLILRCDKWESYLLLLPIK